MTAAQRTLTLDEAIPVMIANAVDHQAGQFAKSYMDDRTAAMQRAVIGWEKTNPGVIPKDILFQKMQQFDKDWTDKVNTIFTNLKPTEEEGLAIPPEAAQNFAGKLIGGDSVPSALSGFMMSIKSVQDASTVLFTMATSLLASAWDSEKNKAVSWDDAWQQIAMRDKTAKAADAFAKAGIIADRNAFATAASNIVVPVVAPDIELDVSFNDESVKSIADPEVRKKVQDLRDKGMLKDNLANREALGVLDGVMPNIAASMPGVAGNSLAKIENSSAARAPSH